MDEGVTSTVSKVTKPKPREWPVIASFMTTTSLIVPNCPKCALMTSSVDVPSPPRKILVMAGRLTPCILGRAETRRKCGGFGASGEEVRSEVFFVTGPTECVYTHARILITDVPP